MEYPLKNLTYLIILKKMYWHKSTSVERLMKMTLTVFKLPNSIFEFNWVTTKYKKKRFKTNFFFLSLSELK